MKRILAAVLACLLFVLPLFGQQIVRRYPLASAGGGSSVAYDNAASGSSPVSLAATGSSLVVIVWVFIGNSSRNASTVTFGAQSLTFVDEINDGGTKIELWRLYSATAGTSNVTVTMNAGPPVTTYVTAMSFTGATSISAIVEADSVTGGGSNPSLNISSATNEIVADAMLWTAGGAHTATPGAGQTARSNNTSDADVQYATSTETGSSTTTMSWTLDLGANHMVVAIKP